MTSKLLWLGVLAALASCGPTAKSPPPAPLTVQIRVTHPAKDKFHVEYTLPQAAARIAFQRESRTVRVHWVPVDAKLEGDALVAAAPRTRFDVDLTVDDVHPDKDYSNYFAFTDGGRLLYLGHLAATKWPGQVTLVAAPDEQVIVHGQPPGPIATTQMLDDGTYAYFGNAKPIVTDDFVGVIDPGFPPSIRADLDTLLPRVFKLYGDGLGRPQSAAEKPLLFASYKPRSGPGATIEGGVMHPRVVNMAFELAGEPVSESTRLSILTTIAHESAHLWNGDLYSSESAWIGEGTADALAFRALRTLGEIDDAVYLRRQSDALSLCIVSLTEGESFANAERPGHYKELYFCGATIALLSEAAAREPLIAFLKEVYAGPDNKYDPNRYFEILGAKDAEASAFVRKLVTDKLPDPIHDLPNALGRAGIALQPTDAPGDYYNGLTAPYAIRALLDRHCLENLSLPGDYGWPVTVKASSVCGEMEVGDRFETLAGVKFRARGSEAWDAAFAQCAKDGFVRVARRDKPEARVPCAKTPRERPPYLQVVKAR